MKRAFCFDLDGTLIESLGDIVGHMNRVRQDYGFEPRPVAEVAPFIGSGVEYLAGNAIPELPAEEIPYVVTKFREYYAENPHVDGYLYEGVRDTLEILRRWPDVSLAVVTNKGSAVAERALEHYLPGFQFDCVHGPDRVSNRKPNAAHLLETLELLGCEPQNSWFIGDHEVDRICAKSAGVNFLAAGYGFGNVEVPSDRCLSSFRDFLVFVEPKL